MKSVNKRPAAGKSLNYSRHNVSVSSEALKSDSSFISNVFKLPGHEQRHELVPGWIRNSRLESSLPRGSRSAACHGHGWPKDARAQPLIRLFLDLSREFCARRVRHLSCVLAQIARARSAPRAACTN